MRAAVRLLTGKDAQAHALHIQAVVDDDLRILRQILGHIIFYLYPIHGKNAENSRKNIQEEKSMEKTLKIEGMMCGHCEATVKKALEAVDGVEAAVVSHEKGTAVVTLAKEIDADVFKKIIEDKDFTFIGME